MLTTPSRSKKRALLHMSMKRPHVIAQQVLMTKDFLGSFGKNRRMVVTARQVQDAKARFSELLDTTLKKGPQVVSRRGVEAAVLVPIEEWRRLQKSSRPGLKVLLLGPGPRFEGLVPARHRLRRRKLAELK